MLFSDFYKSATLPDKATALPDRQRPVEIKGKHCVLGTPMVEPVPDNMRKAVFGLGCFWGAERLFWQHPGVYSTAVGYAGGITANPSYEDVCSGRTGHAEVVLVYYDPDKVSYGELLKLFWESHDPTQGMRQGNDRGTQYRSAIYTSSESQAREAEASRNAFADTLQQAGYGMPTTEIKPLEQFYYAEDYHQQYLAKNPGGYCGLAGTGQCYEPVQGVGERGR